MSTPYAAHSNRLRGRTLDLIQLLLTLPADVMREWRRLQEKVGGEEGPQ